MRQDPGYTPRGGLLDKTHRVTPHAMRACGASFLVLASFLAGCGGSPPTPGNSDSSFEVTIIADAGNDYYPLAVQPDGKFLVGGGFDGVGGARLGIARRNVDGTPDLGFHAGIFPYQGKMGVDCAAVLGDGSILIAGDFAVVSGGPLCRVARLKGSDGSLDATFTPAVVSARIEGMTVQEDGKILIVGAFSSVNGNTRQRIARLEANGNLEAGFDAGAVAAGTVYTCVALQSNGQILVSGYDAAVGFVRRFGSNGALDPDFGLRETLVGEEVLSVVVQPDGKILIGGTFTALQDLTGFKFRKGLARLLPNGLVEDGFGPLSILFPNVRTMALQADGGILIGGFFGMPDERNAVVRVLSDGTIDETFHVSSFFTYTAALVLRAGGEVLVAGGDDLSRYLRQIYNVPAYEALELVGGAARWTRTGTAPEIGHVTFELSTDNGGTWTLLGPVTRNSDGWEVGGLSLPASGQIRARGRPTGSQHNACTGLVESVVYFNPPDTYITSGPSGVTRNTTANFGFSANTPTLSFTYVLDGGAPIVTAGTTASLSGLSQGSHTFSVFATDQLGNADPTPATRTWTVDANATPAGSSDLTFVHSDPNSPFVGGRVTSIAVQPDGKIIIAGDFSGVENEFHRYLARFSPDGLLESTFNAGTGPLNFINAVAVQPDGKILIAGSFAMVDGQTRNQIARYLPNGTLESATTFHPGSPNSSYLTCVLLQRDGKILVAGNFTVFGGQPRIGLVRLLADGTFDATFNPGLIADNGFISSLALQDDGKILVGGAYFSPGGVPSSPVFRLLENGALDPTFNSTLNPFGNVRAMAVQANGWVLVAGFFPPSGNGSEKSLVRLFANGTTQDSTFFNPGTGANQINDVIVQTDGSILLGGEFTTVDGQPRGGIARLNPNGSLEGTNTFDTGLGARNGIDPGAVNALAVQADGKILVGGLFSGVSGRSSVGIARLNNDVATATLTRASSILLQWHRGGASPEIGQMSFEFSSNGGGTWSLLGAGSRIPGGWQLDGPALPSYGLFRARGRADRRTGNVSLLEQTLSVLSAVEQWRATRFGVNSNDPAIAGNDADPDGDGAANLFEYMAGTDPLDPISRIPLVWSLENGVPVLVYERSHNAPDVVVTIERSDDLQTWFPQAFSETVISNNGSTYTMRAVVVFDLNNPGNPRSFFRAKVIVVP